MKWPWSFYRNSRERPKNESSTLSRCRLEPSSNCKISSSLSRVKRYAETTSYKGSWAQSIVFFSVDPTTTSLRIPMRGGVRSHSEARQLSDSWPRHPQVPQHWIRSISLKSFIFELLWSADDACMIPSIIHYESRLSRRLTEQGQIFYTYNRTAIHWNGLKKLLLTRSVSSNCDWKTSSNSKLRQWLEKIFSLYSCQWGAENLIFVRLIIDARFSVCLHSEIQKNIFFLLMWYF